MKSKFCFVLHAGELSPEDKVYQVWIGTSKRDQVKKTLLECYAEDCGAYFRQWDEDTDYELRNRMKRLVSASSKLIDGTRIISCTISQLYSAIINDSLSELKNPPNVLRNYMRTQSIIFPAFFQSFSRKNVCQTATPVRRQNLKPSKELVSQQVVVSFWLILALFIIGALLEGYERSLYVF